MQAEEKRVEAEKNRELEDKAKRDQQNISNAYAVIAALNAKLVHAMEAISQVCEKLAENETKLEEFEKMNETYLQKMLDGQNETDQLHEKFKTSMAHNQAMFEEFDTKIIELESIARKEERTIVKAYEEIEELERDSMNAMLIMSKDREKLIEYEQKIVELEHTDEKNHRTLLEANATIQLLETKHFNAIEKISQNQANAEEYEKRIAEMEIFHKTQEDRLADSTENIALLHGDLSRAMEKISQARAKASEYEKTRHWKKLAENIGRISSDANKENEELKDEISNQLQTILQIQAKNVEYEKNIVHFENIGKQQEQAMSYANQEIEVLQSRLFIALEEISQNQTCMVSTRDSIEKIEAYCRSYQQDQIDELSRSIQMKNEGILQQMHDCEERNTEVEYLTKVLKNDKTYLQTSMNQDSKKEPDSTIASIQKGQLNGQKGCDNSEKIYLKTRHESKNTLTEIKSTLHKNASEIENKFTELITNDGIFSLLQENRDINEAMQRLMEISISNQIMTLHYLQKRDKFYRRNSIQCEKYSGNEN